MNISSFCHEKNELYWTKLSTVFFSPTIAEGHESADKMPLSSLYWLYWSNDYKCVSLIVFDKVIILVVYLIVSKGTSVKNLTVTQPLEKRISGLSPFRRRGNRSLLNAFSQSSSTTTITMMYYLIRIVFFFFIVIIPWSLPESWQWGREGRGGGGGGRLLNPCLRWMFLTMIINTKRSQRWGWR